MASAVGERRDGFAMPELRCRQTPYRLARSQFAYNRRSCCQCNLCRAYPYSRSRPTGACGGPETSDSHPSYRGYFLLPKHAVDIQVPIPISLSNQRSVASAYNERTCTKSRSWNTRSGQGSLAISGLLSFGSCVMLNIAWLLARSGVGAGIGGTRDRVPLLHSPPRQFFVPIV